MRYVLSLLAICAVVGGGVIAFSPRAVVSEANFAVTGDFVAAGALAEKLGARLLIAVDERPG